MITAGTSRVAHGPHCLHAVATTPADPMETCSLVHSHRLRPSPNRRRVGPCIVVFEACSAFTHVTACMLAESPMRPSTPKASAASLPPLLLRLLPGGTNQLPGGISLPLRTSAFFTAHSDLLTTQFVGSSPLFLRLFVFALVQNGEVNVFAFFIGSQSDSDRCRTVRDAGIVQRCWRGWHARAACSLPGNRARQTNSNYIVSLF
jgi:hypothetical protein